MRSFKASLVSLLSFVALMLGVFQAPALAVEGSNSSRAASVHEWDRAINWNARVDPCRWVPEPNIIINGVCYHIGTGVNDIPPFLSTKGSKPVAKNKQFKDANHGVPAPKDAPRTLSISREYGVGSLALSNTGMSANVLIVNPFVSSLDGSSGHSLYQFFVSSNSQAEGIEFGIRKAYSGGNPLLFVGYRTGGVFQGYNVGVNNYPGATSPLPGDSVAGDAGTAKALLISYDSVGTCGTGGHPWAISYGGAFKAFVCSDKFAASTGMRTGTADFGQAFGEVTIDSASSHAGYYCSDMGNGVQGSAGTGTAAYFGSLRLIGQATTNPPTDFTVYTDPASPTHGRISVNKASARTFSYGGPGDNSGGTAVGSTGSC